MATLPSIPKGGILRSAIRHKKIIYLFVAALIAVGITGLLRMNRDEFPTFKLKQGMIAVVYPGATAEEVRDQVAKPLEEVLFSFPEVDRTTLRTTSQDGICYILADLRSPARTKDEVWSRIKLRLQAAKLTLPAGVLAVVVLDDFSETASMLITLESDDKGYSELRTLAEELRGRLREIPTMGSVTIYGIQDEEIAVTLDMDRIASYGVNAASLLLDYQSASLGTPGGVFHTDRTYSPVHVENLVSSEEQVADRIVYTGPDGGVLRLGDIATVERRYQDPESFVSYNGHSALVLGVVMQPDNNIVDFGHEVDRVLADFSASAPASVRLSRITDQPKVVHQSVMNFMRDLLIAMLVVVLVMLLLFPMRSALIASSGVPVCIASALAVMYLTGMQVNMVTLAALIVVLGMIVDDSIITMDGYMDKLGRGLLREEAAVSSGRELFMPMLMATSAISLMFFPTLGIITGYLGDFIRSFPWIIAFALAASLAYAMLVVPSLEVRYIQAAGPAQSNFLSRAQASFFAFIQRIYDRLEAFCFRHAFLTVATGVVAIGLGVFMFTRLNVMMMPKADRDMFAVELFLPDDAPLERTTAVSDSLSRILLSDPRITGVTAFVGTNAPRFHGTYSPAMPGRNIAQLIVGTTSNRDTEALLSEYGGSLEHRFPEALVHFRQMDYQAVTAVEVMLRGAPAEVLKPYADSIRQFMYGMPDHLAWVHSDCDALMPAVDVTLDPEEAARLGVNKSALSLSLAGALGGTPLATLWEGDRQLPVRLYSQGVTRNMTYDALGDVKVPALRSVSAVPLRQVAKLTPAWRPGKLVRYAGQDAVSVSADMRFGKSQPEAMKPLKAYVESEIVPQLPEGVTVRYLGLSASNDYFIPQILWSFVAAVAVLFIFLLLHFKKASVALLTMVLSLLCLFGASFGLWAFGLDFSITAVLGLISLVGIIVRNGIIMFEYAEELRSSQGLSVRDAAFQAGARRMRPIFLTSCTTALGVLPMIISGDLLWMPMGVTICFGTLLSIGLIVLIMPVSYWVVFRGADKKKLTENETA